MAFTRRVNKNSIQDTAFCMDHTGSLLAFADKDMLIIQVIKIPESKVLIDVLRPKFKIADNKLNPGTAEKNKQKFNSRIYKDLHTYHMYKVDKDRAEKSSGVTPEQNI